MGTRLLFFCVLGFAFLVASHNAPARADQNDPRLPGLFKQLQSTKDSDLGGRLARRIWAIWYTHKSDRISALVRDGETVLQKGAFEMAEKMFTDIIKTDPSFAEGWNRRATVRYFRGNFTGSISDINETLRREPRHFGALSGLGLVHLKLKQYRKALAAFERALKVNPHMPRIRRNVERLKHYLKSKEI